MSAKTFDGNVSIVLNTKGEIALKKDAEGKFSAENAVECYQTMIKLAKARKVMVNKYSLFVVERGTEPVLLVNRYGNPYVALLPKRDDAQAKHTAKVIKLA